MLSYLLCITVLMCRCAWSVYLFVIFHKRDLSIGGGEGASRVLLPVDIVNAVRLVVVPGLCEGNAREGEKGEEGGGREEGGERKGNEELVSKETWKQVVKRATKHSKFLGLITDWASLSTQIILTLQKSERGSSRCYQYA